MVFIRKLISLKKILLFYSLFCLYNKNIVYAANENEISDNNENSYSQTTISEELGLSDSDIDNDNNNDKKKNGNNNIPNYYQQQYQQPYQQQPMPIILNMSQPYYPNQNDNLKSKKQINKKIKAKIKKNKEKYLDELKAINDKTIFSNNYNFGDFKLKVKSYNAFTFNLVSLQTFMLVMRIIKDKNNHSAKFNEGNRSTWINFFQDEFTEFRKDQEEEGDYTGGKSIGLVLKIVRCLSNVKWEWKSIKNKHFAVGFELAHLIGPTCLLEFNTGYDKPNVFGGGIKIGLTCGLGIFFTGKINNFYIKVDGPCFSLISMIILLRNSTLKDDETNKRTSNSIWGREFINTFYNKFIKSMWTFKRVNTGWGDNFKDSAMVDVVESCSIGLGWIFPKIDLFEY